MNIVLRSKVPEDGVPCPTDIWLAPIIAQKLKTNELGDNVDVEDGWFVKDYPDVKVCKLA